MYKIRKGQSGLEFLISQQEAQNQAYDQQKEWEERIKNGWLTNSEVNARRFAAGAAALGSGLVFFPHPVVKAIGYGLQVPDWIYNIYDATMDYDSPIHLVPDAANASKEGIGAVTKVIPGKVDDYIGYGIQAAGIADNIDQAAGYDHACQLNFKRKLVKKNKK